MRITLAIVALASGCAAREAPIEAPDPEAHMTPPPTAQMQRPPVLGPSKARPLAPEVAAAMREQLAALPLAMTNVEVGRRNAMATILDGRLMLETLGYPAPWYENYEEILRAEYAITVSRVAGCMVEAEVAEHAQGFNEVMEAEIARRYGPHVLEEVALRAAGFPGP